MKTVKFYTLDGQPIILMPDKKGKHKGQREAIILAEAAKYGIE